MLNFLFDSNTTSEREDTKQLFVKLQTLEAAANLSDVERDQDVVTVLEELKKIYSLSQETDIYVHLKELLTTVADESDLYTTLYSATDVFVDDVIHDSDNRARMARKISLYNYVEDHRACVRQTLLILAKSFLEALPEGIYEEQSSGAHTFEVRITDVLAEPAKVIQFCMGAFFTSTVENTTLFHSLRSSLVDNNEHVHEHVRKNAYPEDLVKDYSKEEVINYFLSNTCLESFFSLDIPFVIPQKVRFEHMHIVAGSGHGKTQTLQYLITKDIEQVQQNKMGFAVIDSQGDLINAISRLEIINEMQDKVVIVDPNDIAFPPSLNMFDVGLAHSENVDPLKREKIINATIDLYAYIFSSLLGAELTQKQSVIFTYLARMMMVVPEANIRTLQTLVEADGQKTFEQYFHKLDPLTRHFYETQFFSSSFSGTRQQVLTRLWGVLSNRTFENMFSAKKNKINLFEAMNEGKIVLINTAKDLLKAEGCSIFGRFFIALVAQSALSRSIIPVEKRKPFMLYVDEAHDYFDDRIEDIANQARKYNVGLSLSHQNLDQASPKLRANIISSTSIKFAGGVSAKDAQILAQNMHTKPETILSAKKTKTYTQFACYVRNLTHQPLLMTIPFGVLESMPKMSDGQYGELLKKNREKVSEGSVDLNDEVVEVQPEELVEPNKPNIQEKQKGKGGAEHKALQQKLADAANSRGIHTRIEEHIGEGKHIDIVFQNGNHNIACEVSISTSVAHELNNVRKCIDAGYKEIWVVCDETAWIESFRKKLREVKEDRVQVFTMEEVISRIENLSVIENQRMIGGKLVVSEIRGISDDEKERREIVLAKILGAEINR